MVGPKSGLASIVTKAVEEIASYAKITNTDEVTSAMYTPITLDNYISEEKESTESKLESLGINVYVLGNGKYIINQYPLKGKMVFANSKVFLVTNDENYLMPDLTGFSASEVKTFATLAKINLTCTGYGYVINQSIPVGTSINSDTNLDITLG